MMATACLPIPTSCRANVAPAIEAGAHIKSP
jgi:hypothetical protein